MPTQQETILLSSVQSFRLLRWEENLREVDSLLPDGDRVRIRGAGDRWHHHPELELTVIERGHGTRLVGDHIGTFTGPEVVLIGANLPHYWRSSRTSSGYALQWKHGGDHPSLWDMPESVHLLKLWKQSGHGLLYTAQTAERVMHLVRQLPSLSGLTRVGRLLEILDTLSACPREKVEQLSRRTFDLSDAGSHQSAMEKVIRFLLKQYREPVTLADTLRVSGMSKATFSRQFLRHTGKTFSAFLTQVRLDAACRQLLLAESTVSEAAFANGFNSLSYFNRSFLQAYRCTPKVYRSRHS